MLVDRLDISERRACRYVGQHRSTQRIKAPVVDPDLSLREWLVEFSTKRPRWGYRRAHRVAVKEGFKVNRKKGSPDLEGGGFESDPESQKAGSAGPDRR